MDYRLKIKKKYIILIQLLLILVLVSTNLIFKVYARNKIERNVNEIPNIMQTVHVDATIEYLDKENTSNIKTEGLFNKEINKHLSNIKFNTQDNMIIVSGKVPLNIIYPEYEGNDKVKINYYFNKSDNKFIKGEIESNNALDKYIKSIVVNNAANSNSNVEEENIENDVNIKSNNKISFKEAKKEEIHDESLSTKLLDEAEDFSKEHSLDEKLLKIIIDNKEYVLGKSSLPDFSNSDNIDQLKIVEKNNINYIIQNNTIIGLSGALKDINYYNSKSEEDLIQLLGKPLKVNNNLYWTYANSQNKTLYISYNTKEIEFLYK